jgi:hypothetical protein
VLTTCLSAYINDFDSKEELSTNNASSSDLIIMDTQTGGWKYVFGISATIQIINEL